MYLVQKGDTTFNLNRLFGCNLVLHSLLEAGMNLV